MKELTEIQKLDRVLEQAYTEYDQGKTCLALEQYTTVVQTETYAILQRWHQNN